VQAGLLSPGGVHSHESQIHAMLTIAARGGVKEIRVHAFLDGRDTPPKSAEASLIALARKCDELKAGSIAAICGRYYAMDRDQRWERVKLAYDLITQGKAEFRSAAAVEGRIVVVEDHRPEGGLGSAVAEALATRGQSLRLAHLAVRGMPGSASPEEQRAAAGIDAAAIAAAVRRLAAGEAGPDAPLQASPAGRGDGV